MISSSYRVPVGGSVVKCKGCRLEPPRGQKGSDIEHTHARTGARARRKIRFMQKPTSKPDTKSAKKKEKTRFCKHRLEGKLFSLLVLLILELVRISTQSSTFLAVRGMFSSYNRLALWPSFSETRQRRLEQQQRQT